jgi:hypothetical protein
MSHRNISPCLALALFAATSCELVGQQVVLNGDFSAGLDNWTLVQPPGNVVMEPEPVSFDVATNSGPLSPTGNSFYAHIGSDWLINLQQNVSVSAGVTYSFYADIATTTPIYNLDNGTISVFIDGNNVASHSFGGFTDTASSLSGFYAALTTGDSVLLIDFSRTYLEDSYTPTDWIDNISLTAVPEPSGLALGACGGILFLLQLKSFRCKVGVAARAG